jgi:16S rRNA (guanine527-N7)-methyltransferase
MYPARIAELLEPFLHDAHGQPLTTNSVLYEHISTYIDILLHWNARINLTAIRDEEEIVTRHFGESLFAARHLFPRSSSVPPVVSVVKDFDFAEDGYPKSSRRLADVGSGAGFPGIPIKLWAPNVALTLIESNHKKVAFLREVARSLTLTDINIQNARAEDVAQTFDVVTLRAVERFADILPVAVRLLGPTGRMALLIARSQLGAARSILPALRWQSPIPVPCSRSRLLLVGTNRKK